MVRPGRTSYESQSRQLIRQAQVGENPGTPYDTL